MNSIKSFADKLKDGEFIVTAEFLPRAETSGEAIKASANVLKEVPSAINVSDNPFGVVMSSLAGSLLLSQQGVEAICQVVTRDRNRIAIQSDLIGAAALGIRNILCLSGYHQVLTDNPESANVYDIDSTQLIAMIKNMKDNGELINGVKINGAFPITVGAVANPFMNPVELNILRVSQKVNAGADFIQTHAVFDADAFGRWIDAAAAEGITGKTAILAGILPLESAGEAEELAAKYTDFNIPVQVIERLKKAGDPDAQKREGIAICTETIAKIRSMKGVRGIHIMSGGKENILPEILKAAGLSGK